MPITPDKSQPHLIPSTSRMDPPSGTLTPIQQFINNSRKLENKEPKYSCSQLDYPNPLSVLRTRARQGYKLYFFDNILYYFWILLELACLDLSYGIFVNFFIPDNNA